MGIEGSLLCTHFGLSGPAALDISRYWTDARFDDPGATLVVRWLPAVAREDLDAALRGLGPRTPATLLEKCCLIASRERFVRSPGWTRTVPAIG